MTAWLGARRAILLGLNLAVAAGIALEYWRPAAQIPPLASSPSASLPAEPLPERRDVTGSIDGPDPFAELVLPLPEPPQVPPEPPPVPMLRLVGIGLGEESFAVIRPAPDAPSQRIKLGRDIAGWTVESIRHSSAVISLGQSRWVLRLGKADPQICGSPQCLTSPP